MANVWGNGTGAARVIPDMAKFAMQVGDVAAGEFVASVASAKMNRIRLGI